MASWDFVRVSKNTLKPGSAPAFECAKCHWVIGEMWYNILSKISHSLSMSKPFCSYCESSYYEATYGNALKCGECSSKISIKDFNYGGGCPCGNRIDFEPLTSSKSSLPTVAPTPKAGDFILKVPSPFTGGDNSFLLSSNRWEYIPGTGISGLNFLRCLGCRHSWTVEDLITAASKGGSSSFASEFSDWLREHETQCSNNPISIPGVVTNYAIASSPECRYCKDTGMVELATSSQPCLDCSKGKNKWQC